MTETCDQCGPAVRAGYRVHRVGELYLCGPCATRHWRALSAQGWTFWPLGVHALAPQASAAAPGGPVRHAAQAPPRASEDGPADHAVRPWSSA